MTRNRSIPPGHTKPPIVPAGPAHPKPADKAAKADWAPNLGNRRQQIALVLFWVAAFLIGALQGDMSDFAIGVAFTTAVVVALSDYPISAKKGSHFWAVIDTYFSVFLPVLVVFVVGGAGLFIGKFLASLIGPMWGFDG